MIEDITTNITDFEKIKSADQTYSEKTIKSTDTKTEISQI